MVKITKNKNSFRGKFFRGSLSFIMDSHWMWDRGFLKNLAKLSKAERHWQASKKYKLREYNLDQLKFEELECLDGDSEKVIIQFHGGAYIMRFFDTYRIVAHKYSRILNGATIFSLDYHTAPNHKFPEALNDALRLWDWLLKRGHKEENIIVVGDSAGGNLALSMTMKLRDEGKKLPKALVLMSPWTDLTHSGDSYVYNLFNDPVFGRKKKNLKEKVEKIDEMIKSYAGDTDCKNKYLSPAFGDFHNFPPMLIQVGSYELLESDSITVYEKAHMAGIDVRLTRYFGMFHVFQLMLNLMPESKVAWDEVQDFIEEIWQKKPFEN